MRQNIRLPLGLLTKTEFYFSFKNDGKTQLKKAEMEGLPCDIIANQIFKYFDFQRWIKSFIYVCKLWRQAAVLSAASKQIVIRLEDAAVGKQVVKALSTFNVDTIIIENMGSSVSLLTQVINASNKLHTVVFVCKIPQLNGIDFEEQEKILAKYQDTSKQSANNLPIFPQVSTLAIRSENLSILRLFPNIIRLKLSSFFKEKNFAVDKIRSYPSVKELEITIPIPVGTSRKADADFTSSLFENLFPSLQTMYLIKKDTQDISKVSAKFKIITDFKHLPSNYHSAHSFDLSGISYHHYAASYFCTPFTLLVNGVHIAKFLRYLEDNVTTPEYEADLNQRAPCFIFPPLCPTWVLKRQEEIDIDGSIMPADTIDMFVQRGFLTFWQNFVITMQGNDNERRTKLVTECSKHLPPTKDIGKAVQTLFEKMDAAEVIKMIGDPEAVKALVNYKDENDETLAFRMTELIINREALLPYMDLTVIKNERNAATHAFGSKRYQIFCELRAYGLELQEKEFTTTNFRHFFDFVEKAKKYELLKYIQTEKGQPSIFFNGRIVPALIQADKETRITPYFFEELGEDFYAEQKDGHALIEVFIKQGTEDFVHYMASKIDINHIDTAGFTPLLYAIKHRKSIEIILQYGADVNFSSPKQPLPIIYACQNSSHNLQPPCDIFDALMEFGADINTVDFDVFGRQMTPLAAAVYTGKLTPELKHLIALGADPKFVDVAGNTLIHTLMNGDGDAADIKEVLQFLLAYVDINQKNNLGESPLHFSLLANYGDLAIKPLLEHGADVNLPGPLNRTPLMMTVTGNTIALEALLPMNVLDLKARDIYGRSFVYYACMEPAVRDYKVALKSEKIMAALAHYASEENIEFIANEVREYIKEANSTQGLARFFERVTCHILLTKFLIEKVGVDVNMQDSYGNSLLSCTYVGKKNTTEVMEYLISKGAKVDLQDNAGDTPLMNLLQRSSITVAQYTHRRVLLKNGASVTMKNNRGISPIELDPLIEARYEKPVEENMSLFDTARSTAKLPRPDLSKLRRK